MNWRWIGMATISSALAMPAVTGAQSLGTFRWQLQPFCNVVTMAVTENGGVYRLEGTDDQCGNSAGRASAMGTAFPNPDGSIGFGLTIVTTPGGASVHVEAVIAFTTLSGSWRDSAGNSGTLAFTPGAGSGGTARPLPVPTVPLAIQLRADGSVLASGTIGDGPIPASGAGVRMMWHPAKAAFRAGEVLGSIPHAWDDANVGLRSVAFGTSTIASGFASTAMGIETTASGQASTAMGSGTIALGAGSTAMGLLTTASGTASTALGLETTASGTNSTALGTQTLASGQESTAMGSGTTASGSASLAAGAGAIARGFASVALGSAISAQEDGSFVFGDRSTSARLLALAPNMFLVRAAGGVYFQSSVDLAVGVRLAGGASAWSSLSDVNRKHHFRNLTGAEVLAKLAGMSIQEWSYKAQDASIRHVGPTAQEFHAAFGLGEDPLRISTIDADGIALRAVQALELREREATATQSVEIEALRAMVVDLRRELAEAVGALHEQKAGLKSRPTVPAQKAGLKSRPTADAKEKQ